MPDEEMLKEVAQYLGQGVDHETIIQYMLAAGHPKSETEEAIDTVIRHTTIAGYIEIGKMAALVVLVPLFTFLIIFFLRMLRARAA